MARILTYSAVGVALILLFGYSFSWGKTEPSETPLTPLVAIEPVAAPTETYVVVTTGCNAHFSGTCAVVRSSPSNTAAVVLKARIGMVLAVKDTVTTDSGTWYHIAFDEWLRYPNRVSGSWFIHESAIKLVHDRGAHTYALGVTPPTDKHIIIDRSDQMLYAYDGDTLFMKESISTGLELSPTPRGVFTIYRKTPSRYMQGPLPGISSQYYDLPGVPWNLYFSKEGAVIHGAYWHDNFGRQWSHGCVNVPTEKAALLYTWADIGTSVLVRD